MASSPRRSCRCSSKAVEEADPVASRAITTVSIALLFAAHGGRHARGAVDHRRVLRSRRQLPRRGRHAPPDRLQQELATELLRWFMPQMLFYGVTALATAMLNARRRFAAAAFAPVLNNVVVIAALLAVARASTHTPTVHSVLDDPVLVLLLGLGTTAGVVAMAVVLVPAVRRAGGDFGWLWESRHPAVRKLARLSGWTVGYVAANQVAFLVVLVLAYRIDGRGLGVPRRVHVLPAARTACSRCAS